MGWFDLPEHSTGELTSRLGADAETVAGVTGIQLGYRVRVISNLVAGVTIALIYDWRIGLVACACVPLIMLAGVVQGICLGRRFVSKGISPNTLLEQGLRGITSVQAYNLQTKVGDDYAAALKPEIANNTKRGFFAGIVFGFSQFSVFLSFSIIFYYGSQLLVDQDVDFVGFFVPVLSVMFGALGASQVSADFQSTRDGKAAAARIFDIVDEPFDDTDPFSEKGDKPESFQGSIQFEGCHFHYPTRPDHPIYYPTEDHDGFSLMVEAKKSCAFVGKSGCGKSTAEAMVLRFYEPTSGQVLIDGKDVKELNITWLRKQMGYVGQNPVLFSGTIKDNILLGKPDATDDEITAACKAANAHGFISGLEQGYNTDIGTSGSLLSGGQRQRVAIARAIISNPPVLILDEATSALDNESEKIVQAALDEMQKTQPRTTLVVAHRLTTVKDCDNICVLGDGGVQELGPHSELLAGKGLYHQLWKLQGCVDEPESAEQQKRGSYIGFSKMLGDQSKRALGSTGSSSRRLVGGRWDTNGNEIV
mmetsp:Transcript_29626/g.43687  ORF Transcript_29626/g.43687 Transcript_29626/m.43687 type:complete len:534 (-) Transcript_29626:101-1702(-)